MGYSRIEVEPIAGALGAEVRGVDLREPLDNATVDEIHRAFTENLVIVLRDQQLDADQYLGFAGRFGEPTLYPFSTGLPESPYIFEILKDVDERQNFGGGWHSDTSYLERPPLGTMLYAHETPPYGGDTMFANMYLAYERLSDGMKELLEGLVGVNSAELKKSGGRKNRHKDHKMALSNLDEAENIVAEHPVVRTHPVSGRKSLYVNQAHTVRFKGWTEEESQPLIAWLCEQAVRPELTCRVRWRPGTITLWDNRCTQHFAINDYHGHRRRMHRITMGAEVPA
jgi:taurine dioxygenase